MTPLAPVAPADAVAAILPRDSSEPPRVRGIPAVSATGWSLAAARDTAARDTAGRDTAGRDTEDRDLGRGTSHRRGTDDR
jgi:hypothetical protein